MVQSRLLNEFDEVLECLGEFVLLFYAVLQKFEMTEQLFRIVLIEKIFLEACGGLLFLLEPFEDVLGAEAFGINVACSVRDSGRCTEIGQYEVTVFLQHQVLTVEICKEDIKLFHDK